MNGALVTSAMGVIGSGWRELQRLWRAVLRQHRRAASDRSALLVLRGMDDRELSDIGLSRADITCVGLGWSNPERVRYATDSNGRLRVLPGPVALRGTRPPH